MDDFWYRQLGPTSWVAYNGRQAIWEATTRGDLVRWLRYHDIEAGWRPLTVLRVI